MLSTPTDSVRTIPDGIPSDAFIVGPTRTFTRDDVHRLHLWLDTDGVTILSIGFRDLSDVSYCYPDYATAKDDHDRITDGSETVYLKGESSRAAHDRIAAVLKATGTAPFSADVLMGRDRHAATH